MCTKNLWGALNERVEKKKLKKSMQRQGKKHAVYA